MQNEQSSKFRVVREGQRSTAYVLPPPSLTDRYGSYSDPSHQSAFRGYLVIGWECRNIQGRVRMRTYCLLEKGQSISLIRQRRNLLIPLAIYVYGAEGPLRGIDLGYFEGPKAGGVARHMDRGAVFDWLKICEVTCSTLANNDY
jgi:hypothetical protein